MAKLIIAIVLMLTSTFANAQLKGSGRTITKIYDYQNFDKLYFQDLDGNIDVEIGKTWSVSVTIDDNLENLLSFSENVSENKLNIMFKGNKNNRKYIEDTNIKIKITLPKVVEVYHSGNSNLVISNLSGTNFKLENSGNGTTKISGSIDALEVINTGNGNTKAEKLLSKTAVIKCSGNGNVYVNVSNNLIAKATGNCSVFNFGQATFDSQSTKSGNARLLNQ